MFYYYYYYFFFIIVSFIYLLFIYSLFTDESELIANGTMGNYTSGELHAVVMPTMHVMPTVIQSMMKRQTFCLNF